MGSYGRRVIEGLESRILFHLELTNTLPDTIVASGTPSSTFDLSQYFDNELITGTIVRMATDFGDVDIEMFNNGAPATVQNFLGYVGRGDYNNTIFHRAVPQILVQGGGYSASTIDNPTHIPEQPPIANEANSSRPNIRATIAMARLPDQPGSATSQFFFNLENNSTIGPMFDTSDGGYAVFGQVINNTMPNVDAIAGLPTFRPDPNNPTDPNGPRFTDIPLQGTPPETADNVVKLQTASVIPEAGLFTYTLTSSNPGLVTPVVENGVLTLQYASGGIGTSEITITATDVDGTTVSDTFSAGVSELNVPIGGAAPSTVTFTDLDGTFATISLKGGSGVFHFRGSNLSQTVTKAGTSVQGMLTDFSLDLTGTGTSGALTVKANGGDGRISITGLTSDGGMKSIAAKQLDVAGNLTFAGPVGKADFGNVTNSTLTFGPGGSLALSLVTADTVDIVSQSPIKSLKAESFIGGGGPDVGAISAPGIGSLTISDAFSQRLDVAGALGTVKIGGAVNSFLPWSVSGGAGKITVGSIAEGFVGDFAGAVASLTVNSSLSGDISAASMKSLAVKGDLSGANLVLTGTGVVLGKATISGAIANSRIQATGNIGSVTANTINASTIYAGVSTDGGILPTDATDFTGPPASIASVTVKSKSGPPSFINSNIAAVTLGKLNLGIVQTGNAGVPFGVAGDSVASLQAGGINPPKQSKLTTPSQTSQEDFQIRVF